MSYQAQTWVDKVGIHQCKNGGELLVLIRVANHTSGSEMRGCYASGETIAAECLMGESTVLKHLRRLKAGGVLLPGDPGLVSHIRADRRPPVYDLAGGHEPGCPGKHSIDLVCRPATTGARSEHPSKKARSAGARSEHPPKEAPATGVQIDLSRVFKSSTDSYKDLNSLFSVPAGAFAAQSSQQPQGREREAAAPEAGRGNSEFPGAAQDADRVVEAYEVAAGRRLLNGTRTLLRAQAVELLAAERPVEWVAARAAEMPANGWTDLIKHCERSRVPLLPGQTSGPGYTPGGATPAEVEALRARLAGRGSGL
ncbi:helix-turn-helix domain-containing protein [Streptomyces atratus]|uniref:helix-turn-helix domain-containing protein n=1 Tax=Streptomyces atratus TaxID=1893 RepID=UPI0021A61F23|nr:helix-turn-helix domain-containing protein [Streptomyces atratus]MCT2544302.1 helix-turn-helix domain-containing protein [Streptomyces atratus]